MLQNLHSTTYSHLMGSFNNSNTISHTYNYVVHTIDKLTRFTYINEKSFLRISIRNIYFNGVLQNIN